MKIGYLFEFYKEYHKIKGSISSALCFVKASLDLSIKPIKNINAMTFKNDKKQISRCYRQKYNLLEKYRHKDKNEQKWNIQPVSDGSREVTRHICITPKKEEDDELMIDKDLD